jgi:hypothetical protein
LKRAEHFCDAFARKLLCVDDDFLFKGVEVHGLNAAGVPEENLFPSLEI